jgi:excisionase family DNA binding protein
MCAKSTDELERLVMTVEQVAVALGISRSTAYMLVNTGRLPAIRISDRRIIIPRKAIDELLASAILCSTKDIKEGT